MRGRMCICCVVVLLSALPAGVWAQEDLIPKGDEVLFGAWVNERAPADLLHGQKVVVSE